MNIKKLDKILKKIEKIMRRNDLYFFAEKDELIFRYNSKLYKINFDRTTLPRLKATNGQIIEYNRRIK